MTKPKQDYQSLNLALETVLAKLQQPDVSIDEAVKLYEQGLELIEVLELQLEQAENKIEQLALAATKAE